MSNQLGLALPGMPPAPPSSHEDEVLLLLGLLATPGVGLDTAYKLFGHKRDLIAGIRTARVEGLEPLLRDVQIRNAATIALSIIAGYQTASRHALELRAVLEAQGVRCLFNDSPLFPSQLRGHRDSPRWLFFQGNIQLLAKRPLVAIVGTREPSPRGIFVTDCACYSLEGTDVVTVSGLALGVDQRVHRTSLDIGLPTVGVIGTGILNNYPPSSKDLRFEILARGGAIVSEYAPSAGPTKSSFVRRNRIQAMLSAVTVPTQWSLSSGTAHTVQFAMNYGRNVIGVSANNPETDHYLREKGFPVFKLPGQSDSFIEELARVLAG